MTKKELKEALDKAGIEYEDDATNAELEALLPEEKPNEIGTPPVEEEVDTKGLSPFLAAYKKQNPEKFAIKMKLGELKGL